MVRKYKRRKNRGDAGGKAQTGLDPWSVGMHWVCLEGKASKLTMFKCEMRIADF